jgi:hypothetical protein
MFGLFKNKEIDKLARNSIEITKIVWNILDSLSKKKKKFTKDDIAKELAKFRIGIIQDEFFEHRIDLTDSSSHRWITASIECDDRKNWHKFNYTILGIMDFGGFSLNFSYKNMEIEAFFLDNQYSRAGIKAKKLHDAVVKLSGYKERKSLT